MSELSCCALLDTFHLLQFHFLSAQQVNHSHFLFVRNEPASGVRGSLWFLFFSDNCLLFPFVISCC